MSREGEHEKERRKDIRDAAKAAATTVTALAKYEDGVFIIIKKILTSSTATGYLIMNGQAPRKPLTKRRLPWWRKTKRSER